MTINEVYEKYAHMDTVFLDPKVYTDSFDKTIIADLWQAIKNEIVKGDTNE